MKISVSVLLLLSLALSGCFRGPGKGTWAGATGAEQFERLMWKSIQEKQWNEVENHLAPAFVGVDAQGRQYDRAGWVEHWKSMPAPDYSLGEISVQPNGNDMVVSYELRLSGGESGRSDSPVRVLSVWQQLKKGWVMIAQTMTPASSP